MTTYESKKKIEAAIEYILPRVMKLDIEHELQTHVTCNRGPPSVPILSYALMDPGAGQDETVTHVTEDTVQVLEAILGKNFTITKSSSLYSRKDDFVRVYLYATYSNTPRAEDPAWIGEMWPRLNRLRVTDNRVVWDPLPRYNAEDWEKELLDKVVAADQFIKQAHSGIEVLRLASVAEEERIPEAYEVEEGADALYGVAAGHHQRGHQTADSSAAMAAGRDRVADRAAEGSDESDSEKLPDVVESKFEEPEESLMSSDSDSPDSFLRPRLPARDQLARSRARAADALEHRRNVLAALELSLSLSLNVSAAAPAAEAAMVAEAAPAAEAEMVSESSSEYAESEDSNARFLREDREERQREGRPRRYTCGEEYEWGCSDKCVHCRQPGHPDYMCAPSRTADREEEEEEDEETEVQGRGRARAEEWAAIKKEARATQ